MKNIFYIFLILFLATIADARALYQPGQTARSRAMGGTSISFVRGVDALYFNAAALARVEGFSFTLAQVDAAFSKNATRLIDQAQNNGSNISAGDLNELYGKTFFADVSVKSGFVIPFFGVGFYSANSLHETFNNPVYPTFNVDFVSDYGYLVAGAIPLGPQTSIGITGRHIKRWSGDRDILVTNLIGSDDKDVIEQNLPDHGAGNALDLSFLTTFGGSLSPSVAVVWQDVGNTRFEPSAGSGPERQDDNLIFGTSIQHDFLGATWTHALEYKFIRQSNEDLSKKIHLGTEASYGLIDLRAGLSQGYLSYGAGLDLGFLRLEATTYTLELGNSAGQSPSDRYQASLSLNLDFDQSFKLKTSEGKKRRLMQRR